MALAKMKMRNRTQAPSESRTKWFTASKFISAASFIQSHHGSGPPQFGGLLVKAPLEVVLILAFAVAMASDNAHADTFCMPPQNTEEVSFDSGGFKAGRNAAAPDAATFEQEIHTGSPYSVKEIAREADMLVVSIEVWHDYKPIVLKVHIPQSRISEVRFYTKEEIASWEEADGRPFFYAMDATDETGYLPRFSTMFGVPTCARVGFKKRAAKLFSEAYANVQNREFRHAVPLFKDGLRLDPENAEAMLWLAESLWKLHVNKEGPKYCDKCTPVSVVKKLVLAVYQKAKGAGLGKPELAERAEQQIQRLEEGLACSNFVGDQSMVRGYPANIAPAGLRKEYDAAVASLLAGEYENAEKAFSDFLAKHPKSRLAPAATLNLAESFFARGQNLASEKHLTFSGNLAQRAQTFLRLGQIHAASEDPIMRAVACAELRVALTPNTDVSAHEPASIRNAAQCEWENNACDVHPSEFDQEEPKDSQDFFKGLFGKAAADNTEGQERKKP
jgi:TolA-binding protein